VSVIVAGENALLSLSKGEVIVSGASAAIARSLALVAEDALEEYSPAMGGKGSYIASALAERVGAKIESVNEPAAEPGVVY
jgi:hypothetical protein